MEMYIKNKTEKIKQTITCLKKFKLKKLFVENEN